MWESELVQALTDFPSMRFSPRQATEALQWCQQTGTQIWKPAENSSLRQLAKVPRVLFVQGDGSLLGQTSIAIVGTRKPTPHGVATAAKFASQLASAGIVVVSGLAAGIDSAAHRGALAVRGKTVAVMGAGLDIVYPRFNRSLFDLIIREGGCVVSEFPPGTPPLRHHFPMRNRIIAALGRATIVIEARLGSGSLITAECAADLGRDVFVVPGHCDDKNYEGGHKLIQEGAGLILDANEMLEEWGGAVRRAHGGFEVIDNPVRRLFHRPVMALDELFSASHWTLSELVDLLQSAKARGSVIEFGHQRYVYVDENSKSSLPNEK